MTERKRVHATGPRNAKIMIVGMAPAKHEMLGGQPFVGPSGDMLNKALAINGINRRDCFITNILEWQIPHGELIFDFRGKKRTWASQAEIDEEVVRLAREINQVKPNVIFALGNDPLFCLTGRKRIVSYRGSILPLNFAGVRHRGKVVASLHPSGIMQGMWKYEPIFYYVDTPRMKQESETPSLVYPERVCHTKPSLGNALEWLRLCEQQEWVSFDIETIWWSKTQMGAISCISFAFSEREAMSIPFVHGGQHHYWGVEEECEIWRAIASLLQSRRTKKIGQNVTFDIFYLWHHGVFPYPVAIDTMLLHHCLYPDFGGTEDITAKPKKKSYLNPGHSLRLLTSLYTRTPYYKADGREWDPSMGDERFWRYNAMDAMTTYEVAMKMKKEAELDGLWEFFNGHYMSHLYTTLRMEWEGISIDVERRNMARQQAIEFTAELQSRINAALGYELNVASPKQMADLLYVKRGYQVKKKRGTQKVTADKHVLEYFAAKRNDPVLKDIIQLKKVLDEISDVYDIPLTSDGRMQTHFKIGGAGGSRWSSTQSITGSGTNLQSVRRDGIARELFLPT